MISTIIRQLAKSSKFVLLMALTMSMACSENKFSYEPPGTTPTDPNKTSTETEIFSQKAWVLPVDILVIVDNSSSMAADQVKLGARIGSLLSYLSDVDWRLAITTTDVLSNSAWSNGRLVSIPGEARKFIDKTTSNALTKFQQAVVRTETGSDNEQPMAAAIMALQRRNTDNAGFFRDEASLAMIVISDEDEMSSGPSGSTQPHSVVDAYKQVWPEKDLLGFGIIIQPGDSDCFQAQFPTRSYGVHVMGLAYLTGGHTGSICATDYGSYLAGVGDGVRKLLNVIELKKEPIPDSVEVKFVPESPDTRWALSGKRIRMTNPPPEGTRIEVTYEPKNKK